MLLKGSRIALLAAIGLLSSTLSLGAPLPQTEEPTGVASGTADIYEGPTFGVQLDQVLGDFGDLGYVSYSAIFQVVTPDRVDDDFLKRIAWAVYWEMDKLHKYWRGAVPDFNRVVAPNVMAIMDMGNNIIYAASSVRFPHTENDAIQRYRNLQFKMPNSISKCLSDLEGRPKTKSHNYQGLCAEINLIRLDGDEQKEGHKSENIPYSQPKEDTRVVAWHRTRGAIDFCAAWGPENFGCRDVNDYYSEKFTERFGVRKQAFREITGPISSEDVHGLTVKRMGNARHQIYDAGADRNSDQGPGRSESGSDGSGSDGGGGGGGNAASRGPDGGDDNPPNIQGSGYGYDGFPWASNQEQQAHIDAQRSRKADSKGRDKGKHAKDDAKREKDKHRKAGAKQDNKSGSQKQKGKKIDKQECGGGDPNWYLNPAWSNELREWGRQWHEQGYSEAEFLASPDVQRYLPAGESSGAGQPYGQHDYYQTGEAYHQQGQEYYQPGYYEHEQVDGRQGQGGHQGGVTQETLDAQIDSLTEHYKNLRTGRRRRSVDPSNQPTAGKAAKVQAGNKPDKPATNNKPSAPAKPKSNEAAKAKTGNKPKSDNKPSAPAKPKSNEAAKAKTGNKPKSDNKPSAPAKPKSNDAAKAKAGNKLKTSKNEDARARQPGEGNGGQAKACRRPTSPPPPPPPGLQRLINSKGKESNNTRGSSAPSGGGGGGGGKGKGKTPAPAVTKGNKAPVAGKNNSTPPAVGKGNKAPTAGKTNNTPVAAKSSKGPATQPSSGGANKKGAADPGKRTAGKATKAARAAA